MGAILGHHGLLFGGLAGAYLDSLATTPNAVYSLRKMISTATVAIRVRRSSDNAEQDIGFVGTALDTSGMLTFVGAFDGFVVKFYDQTGNGYHAEQATASKQPRIVLAGVSDGKLVFDGSADALKITSFTNGTSAFNIYGKLSVSSTTTVKMLLEMGSAVDTGTGRLAIYDYLSYGGMVMDSYNAGAGTNRALGFNNTLSGLNQWSLLANRTLTGVSELAAWRNGTSLTGTVQTSTEQSGTYTTGDIFLGARNASSFYAPLNLETLALYAADTASIRTSIEAIVA